MWIPKKGDPNHMCQDLETKIRPLILSPPNPTQISRPVFNIEVSLRQLKLPKKKKEQ